MTETFRLGAPKAAPGAQPYNAGRGRTAPQWVKADGGVIGPEIFIEKSASAAIVTQMTNLSPRISVLSLRVNAEEGAMLEAAAEPSHTSLSDFARRKAMEAAESDVLIRSMATIAVKDWEPFEVWLDAPPVDIPTLRDLARRRPSWKLATEIRF